MVSIASGDCRSTSSPMARAVELRSPIPCKTYVPLMCDDVLWSVRVPCRFVFRYFLGGQTLFSDGTCWRSFSYSFKPQHLLNPDAWNIPLGAQNRCSQTRLPRNRRHIRFRAFNSRAIYRYLVRNHSPGPCAQIQSQRCSELIFHQV